MKFQTLQALLHIEALGSIRAAVQQANLSQPALTTAIQQLEEELNAPLLVRTKQGASFTEFGRAFLVRARLMVEESRRAREEIDQLRGRWAGSVRFSTSPAVALSLLPQALQDFRRNHPDVQVECRDGLYPGIAPALRDGTLDFGLTPVHRQHIETDLVAEPLLVTDIVIACHRTHPLRQATRLAELADCAWVYSSAPRRPGGHRRRSFRPMRPGGASARHDLRVLPGPAGHRGPVGLHGHPAPQGVRAERLSRRTARGAHPGRAAAAYGACDTSARPAADAGGSGPDWLDPESRAWRAQVVPDFKLPARADPGLGQQHPGDRRPGRSARGLKRRADRLAALSGAKRLSGVELPPRSSAIPARQSDAQGLPVKSALAEADGDSPPRRSYADRRT